MALIKGQSYQWADILRETGAENVLPYYLLRRKGGRKIVAASLDIGTNSRAPYEVWAGNGPQIKRWADVLDEQTEPFAVFVCELDGKRYFHGMFERVRSSVDKNEIQLRAQQVNRTDIYKILFLVEVS